ncbi:MAG TPA: HAMP domain-containing sensor histidine kinase [Lacipirellula sp.]
MRLPLRRQMMLPLLAVSAVSLATIAAFNARLAERQTQRRIERQVQGVVEVLSTSNFPLTASVLRQMRDLSNAEFVVTDERGAPLASSFDAAVDGLPPARSSARSGSLPFGSPIAVHGQGYFHTAVDLAPRPSMADARALHVLFPQHEYLRSWREAFVPPLIVGGASMLAVGLAAHLLAGRISRATRRLGDNVLKIAQGNFAPAELPATDDEIRDLALAVNRTAGMLAEYEGEVRRTEQMRTAALLGTGLAHEMRNAATGCRMAIDLHAENCAAHDDDTIAVAKRQLQLMEGQLQKYLQAGKASAIGACREIDLGRLFADVMQLVRPAARHAKVDLQCDLSPGEVIVDGDDEALGQAIVNLLINAIEAAQQSGGVEPRLVSARLRSDRTGFAELVIADNGPGPAAAVAGELFAPFVSSKPEGAGLGLANVKRIVEAHRGAIEWMRTEGLTQFRIEIPLAQRGSRCV